MEILDNFKEQHLSQFAVEQVNGASREDDPDRLMPCIKCLSKLVDHFMIGIPIGNVLAYFLCFLKCFENNKKQQMGSILFE